MTFTWCRRARAAAAGIGLVLALNGVGLRASAEHSLLEQVSTGPAGGNGAFDADLVGVSDDGTRAFFHTFEQLVTADTDAHQDVYQRSGGRTTLISTGPAGGNGNFNAGLRGASRDGTRVFFGTSESLVSGDTDTSQDVYERSGGRTTLISTGPAGGNGGAVYQSASRDGTRVFFHTSDSLVSGDTDTSQDVYERAGGQTTLISTGPTGGNGATPAHFLGASGDGTRVLFRTDESLVSGDTDTASDVYARSGGQTTLISNDPAGGNGADVVGVSRDATRVFFATVESRVSDDTDRVYWDVYEWSNGRTTLLSKGPAGGNGNFHAGFGGMSEDGTRVFFETEESLVRGDTDTSADVYERAGGRTTLISTDPAGGNGAAKPALFRGASRNGTRVVFETAESLVRDDTDRVLDLYERSGGQTTLLSQGPAGGNGNFHAYFSWLSGNGTRVFFETDESLVRGDTDKGFDVYERSGGRTTLISTGPAGGNGAAKPAIFLRASRNGTRVFLATSESLVSGDTDTAWDVYVKRVAAPANTARPTISGTTLVGRRLSCSRGTWTNNPTTFTFGWNRAGAPITRATTSTYTLTRADGARTVTCTVTAVNGAGSQSMTSRPVTARFPGPCANRQTGTAARERLTGTGFGDALRGRAGNDILTGRAGADCLTGGTGSDRLAGGAGRDRLTGGAGRDIFAGGAGNDSINSRDRRGESVSCGPGRQDRVTADRLDRLVGCEIVTRR